MSKPKKKSKRNGMFIDIPASEHKQLKALAVERGDTLSALVVRALRKAYRLQTEDGAA